MKNIYFYRDFFLECPPFPRPGRFSHKKSLVRLRFKKKTWRFKWFSKRRVDKNRGFGNVGSTISNVFLIFSYGRLRWLASKRYKHSGFVNVAQYDSFCRDKNWPLKFIKKTSWICVFLGSRPSVVGSLPFQFCLWFPMKFNDFDHVTWDCIFFLKIKNIALIAATAYIPVW